jgi:hypothetical protein
VRRGIVGASHLQVDLRGDGVPAGLVGLDGEQGTDGLEHIHQPALLAEGGRQLQPGGGVVRSPAKLLPQQLDGGLGIPGGALEGGGTWSVGAS